MRGKLYEIIFLRFIAVISIVLGHCFAIYSQWSTSLDSVISSKERLIFSQATPFLIYGTLPLFVCISGYLFAHTWSYQKNKTSAEFIKGKAKRLMIPAITFSLLYTYIFKDISNIDLISLLKIALVNGAGHIWFLYMLFVAYIIGWFHIKYLKKYSSKRANLVYSLLPVMIVMTVETPLGVGMLFFYYFFFYLGFVFYENKARLLSLAKMGWKLLAYYVLLFLLFLLLKVFIFFCIKDTESLKLFNHWLFRLLVGVSGCVIFFSYSLFFVSRYNVSSKIKVISRNSFLIYLLHQFILLLFLKNNKIIILHEWTGYLFPFVLFFFVFMLSFYLSKVLLKNNIINKIL